MVSSKGGGELTKKVLGLGYWVQGLRCFPWLAVSFFLKDGLNVDPSTLQLLQNSANLPMVGKPLYGLVSDSVYISGQHRVPYIAIGDSGSSADSEPDIPKASAPFTPSKEKLGPGLSLDQKNGDLGNSETGIDSMNAVGHVEPSSLINPVINEPESHQEGESAPSKRQVSPDKLYRAALLRSRFADTILKAQEKALEKGEKQDPEKLRMEREELERRKKEEKARLKAEAKAAEEAQRKAEAKAAAEAKRRRELEREEARQALQKMEKTVDINESSQFLEDLEMLSGVQDEPLISFAEESSPDRPQNGLGSFKRQGSFNPLEQLGLYMKVDDEDEEEEPPKNEAGPTDDVEEGEID